MTVVCKLISGRMSIHMRMNREGELGGFARTLDPQFSLILKYIAVATAGVGSLLVLKMQCDIAGSRIRLEKFLRTYFAENELRGIGLTDKEIKKIILCDTVRARFTQFRRGWEFFIPLISVLGVGALLVWLKS
jgi:hypothetical protein